MEVKRNVFSSLRNVEMSRVVGPLLGGLFERKS